MPPTMFQQGKMLETEHPTIWWTPYATHHLELRFEDIDKIKRLKRCGKRKNHNQIQLQQHMALEPSEEKLSEQ
jgi:hypothetical protein